MPTDRARSASGDSVAAFAPFCATRSWRDSRIRAPAFLLFAAFVAGSFFLARGHTEVQLALLTGALGIGSQLWKIHATGVYVTWYYGFLLLGFLGHQARAKDR